MSNKPNPVALTAAMLMDRWHCQPVSKHTLPAHLRNPEPRAPIINEVASLASDLHRLAPAFARQGVAECNGEWRDGQREAIMRAKAPQKDIDTVLDKLDASIVAKREQLTRKLIKLNARLAPFAILADGHAGGGIYLGIESTDATRPLDMVLP